MTRLAILAIVAAFALPCAACDPNRPDPRQNVMMRPKLRGPNTPPPAPPEPLVSVRLVRAVLFPEQALVRWGLDRIRVSRGRGPQTVGVDTSDLDIPIRRSSFGR
jgi:hypothetical protein